MKPKPIREAVVKLYMAALIAQYRALGANYIELDVPALETIRLRADFASVIDHLAARGLVEVQPGEDGPYAVVLTDAGMKYFEDDRTARSERRWTRGLAIAAIIISLAALLLEFESRGYFDWLKTIRSAQQSSEQSPQGLSQ